MKRPLAPELAIQSGFLCALRYVAPAVHAFAIPNAAKRSHWAARQALREGMKAGVPDLYAFWPGGDCFMEFKAPNGRVQDNQREWHERLSRCGKAVAVVRSVDEAVDFIRSLGAPVTGRIAA